MRVTVCEISEQEEPFIHDWIDLKNHVLKNKPDLLILPDLAFFDWRAEPCNATPEDLEVMLEDQNSWIAGFRGLNVKYIAYSKLELKEGKLCNTACIYISGTGNHPIYSIDNYPGAKMPVQKTRFKAMPVITISDFKLGMLLTNDLWDISLAEKFKSEKIHMLISIRATTKETTDLWIRQGQTMAVLSGAYCLSSNKSKPGKDQVVWGGRGWVAEPGTGNLRGTTNNHKRFITVEIDLDKPGVARTRFPFKSLENNG